MATVLLAQSKIHARILDEIGTFLLSEVREKLNKDFVSQEKIHDCLKEQWANWTLSRPTWPSNCYVCLMSNSGRFEKVQVGVFAPDPESNKVDPKFKSTARPMLEGLGKKISSGRKSVHWPWWQFTSSSNWGPEFAARLVIESPTSEVELHAEIQELARLIVRLAESVEGCLRAEN